MIISSGIPVPPCNTNGVFPVEALIASKASNANPAQFSGYLPWIFPIPAANIVTPKSAICLHSAGSATSPLPTTPSSSPPIDPTSASKDNPFSEVNLTISVVLAMFSSIA